MSGMYSGDYDLAKGKSPKFVTEKGEKYSFKVKKNGKYTIWISDDKGNIYTKVVTVKGLKNKNVANRRPPAVAGGFSYG